MNITQRIIHKNWVRTDSGHRRRRIIFWLVVIAILLILVAGGLVLADGQDANAAAAVPRNYPSAIGYVSANDAPEYVFDPCGLDVVICPGEDPGKVREVTAYTSRVEETDNRPCEAADGTDICARYAAGEKICATNLEAFGSKLNVPGYGLCTVSDRMNNRYSDRVDVYLGMDVAAARIWGLKNLLVTKKYASY